MTGNYQFAGRIVQIVSGFDAIHKLCREYAVTEKPEMWIILTDLDIRREGEGLETPLPPEYLETLAALRRLADAFADRDTLLFHGSALALDGQGYLFTAKSGTGKSTHARLWRQMFGDRVLMVNDDKPFLKITEEGVFACGSPWDGKHHLSANVMVPLKAICVLRRGEENRIRSISPAEALPRLLEQCYRPEDSGRFLHTLELLDRLAGKVRFYELACNMDPEAAEIAREAMVRQQ